MTQQKSSDSNGVREADSDLVGPFAFTSASDMMREALDRLFLIGEVDKARSLCEQYGFSFAQAKKRAEARQRAERQKAKAAAQEAKRQAKAKEKWTEPSDDSAWDIAFGSSDPNEGVPWGKSSGADAWLEQFDTDLVEVMETLSLAYEAAEGAGIDGQSMDEIAGHEIPVNAIVTRGCDYSEWYDDIAPHVEELGGGTELLVEHVDIPVDDEDEDSEPETVLHVEWVCTWGTRRKLFKRFGEMADRLQAAAEARSGDPGH